MQYNCWSLRCSWSIACRRCSNYIFILHLTPDFNGLGKDNCNTTRETVKFWDLVRLILEVLRYADILSIEPWGTNYWQWATTFIVIYLTIGSSFFSGQKMHCQVISSHGIDHVGYTGPFPQRGRISTTCFKGSISITHFYMEVTSIWWLFILWVALSDGLCSSWNGFDMLLYFIGPWEIWIKSFLSNFQATFNDRWLRYLVKLLWDRCFWT